VLFGMFRQIGGLNLSVATQICTVAIMSGDQSMLHTNVDIGEAEPCSPLNEFDIGMPCCPERDC
jgi:hypothetical protein